RHPASSKSAAELPLLWFALFDQVERLPTLTKNVAEMADSVSLRPDHHVHWQADISRAEYDRALAQIKQHIAACDTYPVNYSFRLQAAFHTAPWEFFCQLVPAQNAGYCAYLDLGDWAICSASPELFFEKQGVVLTSKPMKGTQARGLSAQEDLQRAEWLRQS